MKLKENKKVYFDELSHSYWLGDKELIGCTSLMKKHGLSPDYGGISQEVLEHAAELGSQAHKAIEDYCDKVETLNIPLIKSFAKLGLNIIHTEYLVSDNKVVASLVDLVEEVEGGVVLWDMKRTSTVHKDALATQLGLYKYLFELQNKTIKVVGCKCLPIKKGNKDDILADTCGTPVDITPISTEKVKAILDAEAKGEIYSELPSEEPTATFLTETEKAELVEAERNIAELDALLKRAKAVADAYKERLLGFMQENGIEKLKVGNGTYSVKAEYSRTAVDSARLKAEQPDIYDKYSKTTIGKASLTYKADKE